MQRSWELKHVQPPRNSRHYGGTLQKRQPKEGAASCGIATPSGKDKHNEEKDEHANMGLNSNNANDDQDFGTETALSQIEKKKKNTHKWNQQIGIWQCYSSGRQRKNRRWI